MLFVVTMSFTFTGPTALYLWVGSLLVEPVLLFGFPKVQAYLKLASDPSTILELLVKVPLPSGKQMLGKLATYMEKTEITHGRDGNINSLVSAAAKFQQIRESYKGAFKDLQDEQKSQVRGGQGLAYDQL